MELPRSLVDLCFTFCFCVSVLLPNVYGTGESCQTVKQKVGHCIEIEKCPSMYGLSQQKPLSRENELFLKLSSCDEAQLKVCCDDEDELGTGSTLPPFLSARFGDSEPENVPNDCTTVERQKGNCVPIGLCPPLIKLVKPRSFTTETLNYLRRANCGFEGIVPKVCCSRNEVQLAERGPAGSITSPLLPSTNICGPLDANRIKGGKVANLAEFPWMALLEYKTPKGNRFSCGGSLISNKYVVTAAHCVKGTDLPRDWSLVSVRLGEHDTRSPRDCEDGICAVAIDVKVVEKIVHESYVPDSSDQHHDIALLRLAREVPFTEFLTPICIPTTTDLLSKSYTGKNMTVAGWGLTENDTSSDVLLKLELTVKNIGDCSQVYGAIVDFDVGQLCAGGDADRDSCRGDSGGPLMVEEGANFYIAGIVSFGPKQCGLENWPGVYVRISHYVKWIVDNLKP